MPAGGRRAVRPLSYPATKALVGPVKPFDSEMVGTPRRLGGWELTGPFGRGNLTIEIAR